jgi:hypothetical protein
MSSQSMEVWAHCEWINCQCEDGEWNMGTSVLNLYATEQTAKQAKERHGGYVAKMTINSKVQV